MPSRHGPDFHRPQSHERSSLPSKNFPCISMGMLQIWALVLLGRLVEADNNRQSGLHPRRSQKCLLGVYSAHSAIVKSTDWKQSNVLVIKGSQTSSDYGCITLMMIIIIKWVISAWPSSHLVIILVFIHVIKPFRETKRAMKLENSCFYCLDSEQFIDNFIQQLIYKRCKYNIMFLGKLLYKLIYLTLL